MEERAERRAEVKATDYAELAKGLKCILQLVGLYSSPALTSSLVWHNLTAVWYREAHHHPSDGGCRRPVP